MQSRHFIPSQLKLLKETFYRIISTGEPGVILFPPNTAKSNIVLENFFEITKKKKKFYLFDFVHNTYDDITDFQDYFNDQLILAKKQKVAIILSNGSKLVLEKNYSLLNGIIDLRRNLPNLSLIFLFNIDVTNPSIAKNIRTSLFGNVSYFPLYAKSDVKGFIDNLEKRWRISISSKKKNEISRNCGGYFWLVKQAIRAMRDHPNIEISNLFNTEGVKLALEQFYDALLDSERKVVQKIILGHKIEGEYEEHSLEHLKKIGLISGKEITIPYLTSFIRKYPQTMTIEIKDHTIYINSVKIDGYFSKKEKKIFKLLIENKNKVVSRDDLGRAIWPVDTEESYSDWAVDRLVARLRTKIRKLGMSRETIKTVRNQGYTLIN